MIEATPPKEFLMNRFIGITLITRTGNDADVELDWCNVWEDLAEDYGLCVSKDRLARAKVGDVIEADSCTLLICVESLHVDPTPHPLG